MRLELIKSRNQLLLVSECEEESRMIDAMAGSQVLDGDGFIANIEGEVRLSDGYGEHYISLKKKSGEICN